MENYAAAKAKLFTLCETGIVNKDSDYAEAMIKDATCKLVTYGIESEAEYRATNVIITAAGVEYTLLCPEGYLQLMYLFQENLQSIIHLQLL